MTKEMLDKREKNKQHRLNQTPTTLEAINDARPVYFSVDAYGSYIFDYMKSMSMLLSLFRSLFVVCNWLRHKIKQTNTFRTLRTDEFPSFRIQQMFRV